MKQLISIAILLLSTAQAHEFEFANKPEDMNHGTWFKGDIEADQFAGQQSHAIVHRLTEWDVFVRNMSQAIADLQRTLAELQPDLAAAAKIGPSIKSLAESYRFYESVTLSHFKSQLPANTVVPLNVNQGSAQDFVNLLGISPGAAQAILDDRASQGPFGSVDEMIGVHAEVDWTLVNKFRRLMVVSETGGRTGN